MHEVGDAVLLPEEGIPNLGSFTLIDEVAMVVSFLTLVIYLSKG